MEGSFCEEALNLSSDRLLDDESIAVGRRRYCRVPDVRVQKDIVY